MIRYQKPISEFQLESVDFTVLVIVPLNTFTFSLVNSLCLGFFFFFIFPTIFYPVIMYIRTACSRGLLGRVQKQETFNAVDLYW